MTRKEEIKKESKNRYPYIKGLLQTSAHQEIFMEGAKWADKTMIKKACEWFLHQEEMIGISFEDDFIERFKKAMEL